MSVRHGLMAALAAAAVAAGLTVSGAGALSQSYCSGSRGANATCDWTSAVPLVRSTAEDDNGSNSVCAAALLGGSMYGSYSCGAGSAYHCYSGSNNLTPRIKNGEAFSQVMHGVAKYSEISC